MLRKLSFLVLYVSVIWGCSHKDSTKEKKIFHYNQSEGLSSLDPAFARNQANMWAVNQLYNGLVELDNKLNVVPCLAESWEVSADGKQYTFKLRKGVKFHDSEIFPGGKGREVLARDFVYSFRRLIDPVTASTGAWVFNDKVIRDKLGNISDTCFKAVDNYTLKIYLKQSFPSFLQMLTMQYCYVVPHEGVQKYDKEFRNHPVGTGPFKFKVWEEGSTLIMLKNPNYWRKDEQGKQLPYLDAVQISFLTDKNMSFVTFLKKKIDFISGIDESSKEQILDPYGNIRKEFAEQYKVEKLLYLNTEYLGFQLDKTKYPDGKHPFLNKKVRQAMSYGINRHELIAYIRNNLGIPATSGMTPYPLPSYNSREVKGYDYEPEKALQLLKEAGYPSGRGLPTFDLYTTVEYREITEFLQKSWSKLGIKVNIQINQSSTYREMVDNGRVQFFRGSWIGDYPDAENYMSLFYSKNFSPAGPNKTHFTNKEFDNLYELAQLEHNLSKRYKLYQQMDQIVMNESPVIVLYYDEIIRLMQNKVRGFDANPMNTLNLEKVDFVEDKK
jgi:peptide/nickel transport system substrate-binding protein